MVERWGAAATLLLATPATAAFQPVADRTYRYDKTELHDDGHGALRFALHRSVVFRREGTGWTATVTLDAIDHHAAGAGTFFEAMNTWLLHRPVVVHLDKAGRVSDIDDIDATWALFIDGIDRAAGSAPTKAATALRSVAMSLHRAPRAQRVAMLAAGLEELVIDQAPAVGTRAVSLPPRTAGATSLSGTEQTIAMDGGVRLVTHATGTLAKLGAEPAGIAARQGAASVTLDRVRTLDPATGLVGTSADTITIELAATQRRARSETNISFALK